MSTFIIAEAGVNHNGSIEIAKQLIDVGAIAGVDAVKFQTFTAKSLVTMAAPKAKYQMLRTSTTESQFEMIRKLELSEDDHDQLIAYSAEKGVRFLSTPFDEISLQLLTARFGIKDIKVSSGDLTNAPLLLAIARAAQTVILSTGMSTLAEIEAALGVLAYGFCEEPHSVPVAGDFEASFSSDAGQRVLKDCVTLLHCTTEYPAPCAEVNLRAMDTIRLAFGLTTGYSDHTSGIHIPVAAVARGAMVIEKHFTLDRNLPGPDHQASLEPAELAAMVTAIRDVEQAIGDGIKRPTATEWKNRSIARKSLVSAQAVSKGDKLTVVCKRPAMGMSPFDFWRVQGKPAARGYAADEVLDE